MNLSVHLSSIDSIMGPCCHAFLFAIDLTRLNEQSKTWLMDQHE